MKAQKHKTTKKVSTAQKKSVASQQNLSSFRPLLPRASQLENYKTFFQYLVSNDNDIELADES